MEDIGKRKVLILAAVFVMASFGWVVYLTEAARCPTHHCTYEGSNVICTADKT
jgi:hypothetical protein